MELIVAVAIILVLASITLQVVGNMRDTAELARSTQKIKDLGQAFVDYTTDSSGELPLENADIPNIQADKETWTVASSEAADKAWYNVLPERMGFDSVATLGESGEVDKFYRTGFPLYVPGAPYPKEGKRNKRMYFAIAMNSRLQRRGADGYKYAGTLASIQQPVNTVIFLERGLPKDKQFSKAQRKFNGAPKANPRAFATRHNQKGILLFVDGHTEVLRVTDLITPSGRILTPDDQEGSNVIWTKDPDDDPNDAASE